MKASNDTLTRGGSHCTTLARLLGCLRESSSYWNGCRKILLDELASTALAQGSANRPLLAFHHFHSGQKRRFDTRSITSGLPHKRSFSVSVACLKSVESRCGAVALGRTYPLPPFVWRCLSGSTIAPFPHPLIGRVEGWRAGGPGVPTTPRRTQRADFPHCAPPFASRKAYGTYPAGRLSARRVALDRR